MHSAPLQVVSLSFFFLLTQAVASPSPLPNLGSSSQSAFSPAEEQALGAQIMQHIQQEAAFVTDPLIDDYIQQLGHELTHFVKEQQSFRFFVLQDSSINAFALPGGYIGVNSGLILAARNENEVAGVLAHEISHVTQHHIARMIERGQQMTLPALAALLGGIALSAINPQLGSTAIAGAMAGAQQMAINFTRENEEEADRVGMDLLAQTGFDPRGMAQFFMALQQDSQYQPKPPPLLSTHPVTTQRIADALNRADHYPIPPWRPELHFELIQQRIVVLYTRHLSQTIQTYQTLLKTKPSNPSLRYGYALALSHQQSFAQAQTVFQQLIAQNPREFIYSLALAEMQLTQGQTSAALDTLSPMYAQYPKEMAVTLQWVETLLAASRARQAKQVISQTLITDKTEPSLYKYLAETETQLKNPQASHQAYAEYLALMGDFKGAIQQLERAEKLNKQDNYQQARIKARLVVLKKQLKQQEELAEEF